MGALTGVRVADFSRVLAGPHATMLLADMGADVIKIESPDGDGTRGWKPPANKAGQSTYFAGTNRGKRSVVCDLGSEEGLSLAREYALSADIVIQNFKPGTMEKFGLGYESLAALNPGLIYCSISGFGEEGGRSLAGYDLLVQAVGGLMSITGQPDEKGGEPSKVGVALVDIITGLNAVIGIQSALRARDDEASATRGLGQHIRVNLLSSLLSALANQTSSTLETGVSPGRLGNAHPSISPYETFETADQTIALAVGTDGQFRALCDILGRPELGTDARFATNEARVMNRVELREFLSEALKKDGAETWIARFNERAIPAGRVNTIAQAIELAETLGLDPVAVTASAASGASGAGVDVRTIANPIDMSLTPASYELAPPELGEHQGAKWLPRG